MAAGRCYPGTVLQSGSRRAVAGALVGRHGELFMVTVGHYCDGHVGETVEFEANGSKVVLGEIEQDKFLHDDVYDVGLIRSSADRVGRVALGLVRLGNPYRFARLREIDDLPCQFYLGGIGWRRGVVDSVEFDLTDKHSILVRDTMDDGIGPDFGHSGSPLYVLGADGYELVGLYEGLSDSKRLLRFLHPGPALTRLGFRLT